MSDITDNRNLMISLLKTLVEIESPSHDKAGVNKVGDLIAEEYRQLGAEITIHRQNETGDQVEARFNPSPEINSQSKGRILFLCHMDTVFPLGTLGTMPFRVEQEKIFGPGVSDMKGGIVVVLAALRALVEKNELNRPVTALFTPDEEIGSPTSRPLIEKIARESSLVLVLEPGMVDGALKTWRKGVGDFTVIVHGRAAHAGGDHANGRNAIVEIAHQVLTIQKMTDYDRGTTLNTGVIQGGTASNVVPAEARIEVDLRVLQAEEGERIAERMRSLQPVLEGTAIEVRGGLNRPPMPFDETMKEAFEKIRAIGAELGIELKAGGTGGASDANFVAPLGIPVMDGLGPAGGEYHSEREFIFKESLRERARLVAGIVKKW